MTSSDDLQLPRDPGPVPASLRDAFAWARDAERASAPAPLPDDAALERLADASTDADDESRFALIEQLLGSAAGAQTLAHVVAARSAVTGDESYFAAADDRATIAPRGLMDASVRPIRRAPFARLKPILLAASLMLVAGTSWYVYTLPPAGDEVRSDGEVIELMPAMQFEAKSPITLTWKQHRSDVRYSVEVLDANDEPVFKAETNNPRVVVPASTLKPGTYRWYVRARATDLTEVRSRVDTFTVR